MCFVAHVINWENPAGLGLENPWTLIQMKKTNPTFSSLIYSLTSIERDPEGPRFSVNYFLSSSRTRAQ